MGAIVSQWPILQAGFRQFVDQVVAEATAVHGYLSHREMRFLALCAATPLAEGKILEIGCYHGKSTIVLAKSLALAERACSSVGSGLVSVDPISPEHLFANLERHDAAGLVEFHREYSQEFLTTWQGPIRMVWHDGANEFAAVKRDVELLRPHLSDMAVVAFHDVLNTSGERIRVFFEDVVQSENFGPVGLCGSIGWGIHRRAARDARRFDAERAVLANRLRRLIPFHAMPPRPLAPIRKMQYRVLRWLVPHGEVQPASWLRRVA